MPLLLLLVCLVARPVSAAPRVPPGQDTEAWAAAWAQAGLGVEEERRVSITGGAAGWTITVVGPDGLARSFVSVAPRNQAEREDVAAMVASLLSAPAVPLPAPPPVVPTKPLARATPVAPTPRSTRARSVTPPTPPPSAPTTSTPTTTSTPPTPPPPAATTSTPTTPTTPATPTTPTPPTPPAATTPTPPTPTTPASTPTTPASSPTTTPTTPTTPLAPHPWARIDLGAVAWPARSIGPAGAALVGLAWGPWGVGIEGGGVLPSTLLDLGDTRTVAVIDVGLRVAWQRPGGGPALDLGPSWEWERFYEAGALVDAGSLPTLTATARWRFPLGAWHLAAGATGTYALADTNVHLGATTTTLSPWRAGLFLGAGWGE